MDLQKFLQHDYGHRYYELVNHKLTKYLTNNTQQLNEITSCRTFNWL